MCHVCGEGERMKIDISKYKDVEPQTREKINWLDVIRNPKFCEDCGSKYILKSARVNGYDPITGEPKIILKWYCPGLKLEMGSWSWWRKLKNELKTFPYEFYHHVSFETNEKGE